MTPATTASANDWGTTSSKPVKKNGLPTESVMHLGEHALRVVADDQVSEEDVLKILGAFRIDGRRYLVIGPSVYPQSTQNPIDLLTRRELQIALLVVDGKVNKQIAHRLRISPYTVSSYLKRIFCKLHCHTRAEMAALIVDKLSQQEKMTSAGTSSQE